MGVTNNGNCSFGNCRALHVLPRGYYRAHLNSVAEDVRLRSKKKDRRAFSESRKREDAVRQGDGNHREGRI